MVDYVNPQLEGHLRVNTIFISDATRKAVQEGRADFTPVLLSEFPLLFKNGFLPLDVALVHLSPPDEHGFCSFGVEVGLAKTPAESAKIIIAQVNEQMPRMLGDSFIHVSKLDYIVPVNDPLPEMIMAEGGTSNIIEKISSSIAELIPDGATIQMGLGTIPDTVLKYLYDKKDLGVHTELFSDGVIDLVEAGVLTNARKTLHPGKILSGFVIGTKQLYSWAHDNPLIELHPTEYVNDPFVIAQNERMVAINSAIEIDLTGQVCADGTLVSRIVSMLKQGAGVVTSRNHVRYIVTEYGVADLYGKTICQRARALINITHPDFRKQLEKEARELRYL
jgi:acetyl-CoA hydrolase